MPILVRGAVPPIENINKFCRPHRRTYLFIGRNRNETTRWEVHIFNTNTFTSNTAVYPVLNQKNKMRLIITDVF